MLSVFMQDEQDERSSGTAKSIATNPGSVWNHPKSQKTIKNIHRLMKIARIPCSPDGLMERKGLQPALRCRQTSTRRYVSALVGAAP